VIQLVAIQHHVLVANIRLELGDGQANEPLCAAADSSRAELVVGFQASSAFCVSICTFVLIKQVK